MKNCFYNRYTQVSLTAFHVIPTNAFSAVVVSACRWKLSSKAQVFHPATAQPDLRIRWADTASSPKVNFMAFLPGEGKTTGDLDLEE